MFLKWDITASCNLRCLHCYQSRHLGPDVTYGEARSLIDRFAEKYVNRIHFFGGEPLLHPRFFDIARYCKNKGIAIGLTTNGQLVDDRGAKELLEIGCQTINVSLDGADVATNDRIRGRGTFQRVRRALVLLTQHKRRLQMPTQINISFTMMRYNIAGVHAMVALAERLRVDAIKFATLRCRGNVLSHRDLCISTREMYDAMVKICEACTAMSNDLQVYIACPPRAVDFLAQRFAITNLFGMHEGYCLGGVGELRVTSDARLYPCLDGIDFFIELCRDRRLADRPEPQNNLRRENFWSVYTSEAFSEFFRQTHRPHDYTSLSLCRGCEYLKMNRCWPICQARLGGESSRLYELCAMIVGSV